jgi:2-oxoglutarate ferredoxin oxidoreductase subunit gamma
MARFQNTIQSGGVFFLNSTLIKEPVHRGDIEIVQVPANSVAEEMGNVKSANMIMLGAFIKKSNLVGLQSLMDALSVALKGNKKLVAINKNALKAGY